jgi:hypothetical protein
MTTYSSIIPSLDGMHVNATHYVFISGLPQYTCDTSKSLDGVWSYNAWITPTYPNSITGYSENPHINPPYTIGNQKFIIDLGSEYIIRRIYYENGHSLGLEDSTNTGAKTTIFYGSNDSKAILDIDYVSTNGLVSLWSGVLEKHSSVDASDPKYISVNSTVPYRYYVFRIADNYGSDQMMCIRRIELQTEDGY